VTPVTPRVLMAVGAYYPELAGGSLQCRSLVLALRDRVRFSVLTTTADRGLPPAADVDGIAVHRIFVDPAQPGTKVVALARLLGLAPALAAGHDIFHFHGFTEKMLVLLATAKIARRRTLAKMTSVGWDDPVSIRSRRFGSALAAGLRRVDRLVAVSPAMAERCARAGVAPARIASIPNGVDADRFIPVDAGQRAALRSRLKLPAGVPIVTFVGFWSREKGPDVLFDAWRAARRATGIPAALVCIGSTDPAHAEVDAGLVERVRREIRDETLSAHVVFVERTDEVAAYLQASDVFALPSSREGLSNALLEAMSTGLACVTAAIPGVSDSVIAAGSNGLLVPPGDAAALGREFARLLSSEPLRASLGLRARQTIVERFAMTTVSDRYAALYHELLGRSAGAGL
jgi:glycosyltransferase involved in cell wall biosynthesis